VLSLSLPAGSYVITGKTILQTTSAFPWACELLESDDATVLDSGNGYSVSGVLVFDLATVTLPAPDIILFQCSQPEVLIDNLPAQNSQLVATLVGGIN
jgi:hypothetical protein